MPFSGVVERTNRATPRDGDVNATRSSVVSVTVRGCAAVATTATTASATTAAPMPCAPLVASTARYDFPSVNPFIARYRYRA